MRKHCSQRAQARLTEYQDKYLPPRCYTAIVASSALRDPYHSLKGTGAEMTTLRSVCVASRWTKQPPKAPQPSESPKYHQRCNLTHNTVRFGADQMASKLEDYTSVYKNDFKPWNVQKRLPFKHADSLTVNHGLVIADSSPSQAAADSKAVPEVRKSKPFESITSYRSDYVCHPVQPVRRVKPVHQTKGLLSEPAVSLKPRVAWDGSQDICDKASAFFQEFRTWSHETKFKGKAREAGPPEDDRGGLATTRADDKEHKCQCAKLDQPPKPIREPTKEHFCGTTTMKDDYRYWGMPRHYPSVRKEDLDRPKTTTPQTFHHQHTSNEKPSCCDATTSTHCHAENGALSNSQCSCPGTDVQVVLDQIMGQRVLGRWWNM